MRTRWMAAATGASALALATAATLAQKPEARHPAPAMPIAPAELSRPRWRTPSDPPARVATPAAPSDTLAAPMQSEVPEPTPAPGPVPPAAEDGGDPMAAVDAFLRRNRREADDSIKALGREAEALRARLVRVEAALARWQAVAGALGDGPGAAPPAAATELDASRPLPPPADVATPAGPAEDPPAATLPASPVEAAPPPPSAPAPEAAPPIPFPGPPPASPGPT